MAASWLRRASFIVALASSVAALGAESTLPVRSRFVQPSTDEIAVRSLAGKIDLYILAGLLAGKVEPAPLADDAEFLRRVYLDLAGKIPPPSEARAFLEDKAPDKRQRLIEQLLNGPGYVTHFTNVWRAMLLPEASSNLQLRAFVPSFEAWLREQVVENAGYDTIARKLLTVGLTRDMMMPQGGDPYEQQSTPSPVAFYVAKDAKPEGLAAGTARLFMGIRLECAQCHDHPMAHWKREQFWSFAAFFGGLQKRGADNIFAPVREITGNREIMIPGNEQMVPAAFLDGKDPKFEFKVSTRVTLADWLTASDNPYFARTAVNRLWAHFFGIGIVEPVDDFGEEHPPSHPRLLDDLAREFVAHKYDVKFMIRAITASRAYQLSSTQTSPGQDDPRLFARMAVKGLTPEQLFDSVGQAIGFRSAPERAPRRGEFFEATGPRAEFLAKFASQDSRTDAQTTILQALYLMNGKFITDATSIERSQALAAIADAPFMDPAQRIEALYLATLTRKPGSEELERMIKYVEKGGAKGSAQSALADVFWALLNSAEFVLNH